MYHIQGDYVQFQRSILPDGKVDVLICLNSIKPDHQKDKILKPGAYVQANRSEAFEFNILGEIELIGVRFYPHTFFRVFAVPPAEIQLGIQDLNSFFSFSVDDFISQLSDFSTIHQKLTYVENWILSVAKGNPLYFAFEHELAHQLTQTSSRTTLDAICADQSSYKRIQRYFGNVVGTSPKQYQRLLRLDALHQYLLSANPNTIRWLDVVYELGFYDQSHLSKETKSLMDLTPTQFLDSVKNFV